MSGPTNLRLHGAIYVIELFSRVKDKPFVLEATKFVQGGIHDVGTVESFERISRSLALETNIGRLLMIHVYAEELKKLLPEKAAEIEGIRDYCLETGLLDILVNSGIDHGTQGSLG
jgi:hypothetical protein